jgi:type III pantothenate kinase
MHLYDIGNTNIKHWYDDKIVRQRTQEKYRFEEDKKFYFINVSSRMKDVLSQYKNGVDIEQHIKLASDYQGMGVDRKILCKTIKDGVVVSAGSAITVDVMEDGVHRGGFISLGLYSFRQSFANISDKLLYEMDAKIDLTNLPQNTHEALNYAMFQSIVLMIKNVAHDKKIYFSGGDGELLSRFFSNSIYKKDLIFDGMKKVIKESGC